MSRIVPRYELFDKLECLGGARLSTGGFVDPSSSTTVKSLEGTESVTIVTPRSSDAADVVHEGQILRKWKSDSLVEESPIGPIVMTTGEAATVTITARSLLYTLGYCGQVTQPGVNPLNGLPILEFGVSGTPTELIEAYLTDRDPADDLSDELAAWDVGTIEPTLIVSLSVSWWSPLQFLRGIIEALEQADVLASLTHRRNGTTNYLLDILNDPVT